MGTIILEGEPSLSGEAAIDPLCVVPVIGGELVLFGFVLRHPVLGGLSWARSSPIVAFHEAEARAATESGRRYVLGRRIEPWQVPQEGEEAWLAYDLLVAPVAVDAEAVPPISADPGRDTLWLTACKMARHLGVHAPSRAPAEVTQFLSAHKLSYQALRRHSRDGLQ
jgi:hypothetical protein